MLGVLSVDTVWLLQAREQNEQNAIYGVFFKNEQKLVAVGGDD